MSVLEFHIWARSNPVGEANKLAVITDEDCVAGVAPGGGTTEPMWIEPALHGLGGSAGFTMSRHNALALAANLAGDNIVRVKKPLVSAGYLEWGWVLTSFEHTLISTSEEGGELVTVEGPGLLQMLTWGTLHHTSTVSDQPARGSANHDGVWWWDDEPWGAILTRNIEEGRHSPFPDAAAVGSPLEFLSITFNRNVDSDGNAWPNIDAEFQRDIGTDHMSVADALRESGGLYLVMDASDVDELTLHCYQTYGRDLTGAFATDTVRFERDVNIATSLVRRTESKLAITHLLLRDMDGNHSTEVWSGYVAGDPETWGFWDASQTNDDTLLNQIGQNVINASRTALEPVALEIKPGQEPANGKYLWGPPGTDGHFDVGDTVTTHTGTDPEEYNEASQIVMAVRVAVREASKSDTEEHAERSLKIEPLLNYYSPRYGSSNVGTGPTMIASPRSVRLCDDSEGIAFRDTFTRTLAGPGWGTPDLGDDWDGGDSVDGDKGTVGSSETSATIGDFSLFPLPVEYYFELEPLGGDDQFNANVTGGLPGSPSPGTFITFGWDLATTTWTLTVRHPDSVLPMDTDSMTLVTAAQIKVRVRLSDGAMQGKMWLGTDPEPGDWQIIATGDIRWPSAYLDLNLLAEPFAFDLIEITAGDSCTHGGPAANSGDSSEPCNRCAARGNHQHDYVAAGGTTGQVLQKASDADWDTVWAADATGAPTTANYLVGTAQAGLSAEIVVGTTPGGELGGTWAAPTVDATHAGGTHAPTAADYLVGTAQAGLSAEIVVGTTPGGELAGTWAAPTVDATHSGSSHAGVISTHEAAADPHTGYVREADANWVDLTDGGATALHSHAGGAHTHVYSEVPAGTVDGANDDFTLAATPAAGTLRVYKNGLRQKAGAGNDYTLATATITFEAGNIPQTGDTLLADYES